MMISGVPNHNIEQLHFENISINLPGGGTPEDAKIWLPEAEAAYPETRMFGKVIPSYGLYIRHAKHLTLKTITLTKDKPDARPPIVTEDVQDIKMRGWKVPV